MALAYSLYHYERKLGTTTFDSSFRNQGVLYHYERKLGTTTKKCTGENCPILYHYERKLGTTTSLMRLLLFITLYHYERKLGTTTSPSQHLHIGPIIPLREKIGNYDVRRPLYQTIADYTTTRENWELRRLPSCTHQ